jgi:uncharacterized protein YcaQ
MALAAQGFASPRPERPITARDIRHVIRRLGLIQIDFVNVLIPAHYQPIFSRLGAYPPPLFDRTVHRSREFTEQWPHEACVIPVETWPLLRFRMSEHRVRPRGFDTFLNAYPEYAQTVLDLVRDRGPISAIDVPAPDGHDRKLGVAWFGTIPRAVLEAHFGRGALTVIGRRPDMARVFDLPERWLASEHYDRRVSREEAHRELLERAARSLGVATLADLADYYRLSTADCRPCVASLVDTGTLLQVQVEGWPEPAFVHREAGAPKRIEFSTLLSPFDPLIFYRPRVERLFGFHYRIEIYTPEPQRKYGYYVLPFLHNERLVARVDLKAGRAESTLMVRAAHLEPGADRNETASALAAELHYWANWLGLQHVSIEYKGNLARTLAKLAC